jgi:hypothetical protein
MRKRFSDPRGAWTDEDARRLLEEWQQSGESIAAFARRRSVSVSDRQSAPGPDGPPAGGHDTLRGFRTGRVSADLGGGRRLVDVSDIGLMSAGVSSRIE